MENLKQDVIALFEKDSAPMSVEEVAKNFPEVSLEEMESLLEELWEQDVLCRLESFCSILYTLE